MYRSMDPYIDATVHEYCVLLLHWLALLPQKKNALGLTLGSGSSVFAYFLLGFLCGFSAGTPVSRKPHPPTPDRKPAR